MDQKEGFINYLQEENNNFNYLYTQMLTSKRIRQNNVVYLFDEVGCGKTVSCIIGMAEVISECKDYNKKANILVITPKSVCKQFADEIESKIKIDKKYIFRLYEEKSMIDFSCLHNKNLSNDVNIYVINKERIGKLNKNEKIIWDLVIIDEAQDIVCNNKKQSEIYDKNIKIDNYYSDLLKTKNDLLNYGEDAETLFNIINNAEIFIDQGKKDNVEKIKIMYLKYILANYIFDEKNSKKINLNKFEIKKCDIHRLYETKVFINLSKLQTKKIIFATATPYKESMEIDYMNYTLLSTIMINKDELVDFIYYPQSLWIDKIYGNTRFNKEDLDEMEKSNVSYSFKEITQSLPYNNDRKDIKGKIRKVEKIEANKENKDLLRNRVFDILKCSNALKNRIIIFVSSSDEGYKVFNKIFPNSLNKYNIVTDVNHKYKDDNGITCEFIMNKFGNTSKLENYKKENDEIPDILIITYQVAQVGVNLPTYNYVINYTISDQPGSLEQRYGRIDRLNSKYDTLYNIYYIDKSDSVIYDVNLAIALNRYQKTIMENKHPMKNLLIGENLEFKPLEKNEILIELKKWIIRYKKASIANNKINISKYMEGINRIDSNMYDNCINEINNTSSFIYDEIDAQIDNNIEQSDPEIEGTNAYRIKKILDENVSKLIEQYSNYDNYNCMIKEINNNKDKLGNPGSIIYTNKEENRVIIDSNDIINRICEIRNNV